MFAVRAKHHARERIFHDNGLLTVVIVFVVRAFDHLWIPTQDFAFIVEGDVNKVGDRQVITFAVLVDVRVGYNGIGFAAIRVGDFFGDFGGGDPMRIN